MTRNANWNIWKPTFHRVFSDSQLGWVNPEDILHMFFGFAPVPAGPQCRLPIVLDSGRSSQLTNGHGVAGSYGSTRCPVYILDVPNRFSTPLAGSTSNTSTLRNKILTNFCISYSTPCRWRRSTS
ncbi:hypothetical protein APHAL10511_002869 [Amanita phalloides]|nr:hypothetical protein APHAL10511_002869 [Amanita phalloides]